MVEANKITISVCPTNNSKNKHKLCLWYFQNLGEDCFGWAKIKIIRTTSSVSYTSDPHYSNFYANTINYVAPFFKVFDDIIPSKHLFCSMGFMSLKHLLYPTIFRSPFVYSVVRSCHCLLMSSLVKRVKCNDLRKGWTLCESGTRKMTPVSKCPPNEIDHCLI